MSSSSSPSPASSFPRFHMADIIEMVHFKDLLVGHYYKKGSTYFKVTQILPGFIISDQYAIDGFSGLYRTVFVEFENGDKAILEDKGTHSGQPFAHITHAYSMYPKPLYS
jgi:hypothetical protein